MVNGGRTDCAFSVGVQTAENRSVCSGREAEMAHIYLHRSSGRGVVLDHSGSDVADLAEARDYAKRAIHTLVMAPGPEDWREWILHVSDEEGEEIFAMPFASVVGRAH